MRRFRINVNGKTYEVGVEEIGASYQAAPPVVYHTQVPVKAEQPAAAPQPQAAPAPAPAPVEEPKQASTQAPPPGATVVAAPMPGSIVSIKVNVGDTVTKGQVLLILEAMKMENEIMAPKSGKVVAINTSAGSSVNTGDPLISLA